MTGLLRSLASAFSYFTTLPIGRVVALGPPDAASLSFLPLVGAVVGAAAGCAWQTLAPHAPLAAPFSAVLVLVLLTGAIHVDGFLDCCDALIAYVTPQRRLEILKDPRHGTYAVVGMALLAGAWIVALSAHAHAPGWTLAIACAAARCAAIVNAWWYPYARGGTVTAAFESRPNLAIVILSALAIATAAWWCAGWWGVAACAAAVLASAVAARWASRKLGGGLVGDVYGAIVTLLEPMLVFTFGLLA